MSSSESCPIKVDDFALTLLRCGNSAKCPRSCVVIFLTNWRMESSVI
jgi:hypothetical protein